MPSPAGPSLRRTIVSSSTCPKAILIDEAVTSPAPSRRRCTGAGRGFAQVDATAVLDRRATSDSECIGDEMRVVRPLLSGNPIAVSGKGGGQQQTENNQRDHDLDEGEAATRRAPTPLAESSCLDADLL